MAEKAKEKASEIIATHYPQPLSDERIREIDRILEVVKEDPFY